MLHFKPSRWNGPWDRRALGHCRPLQRDRALCPQCPLGAHSPAVRKDPRPPLHSGGEGAVRARALTGQTPRLCPGGSGPSGTRQHGALLLELPR